MDLNDLRALGFVQAQGLFKKARPEMFCWLSNAQTFVRIRPKKKSKKRKTNQLIGCSIRTSKQTRDSQYAPGREHLG